MGGAGHLSAVGAGQNRAVRDTVRDTLSWPGHTVVDLCAVRQRVDDDYFAEALAIDLPGVASGRLDPGAAGDGAVAALTVDRWTGWHDEWSRTRNQSGSSGPDLDRATPSKPATADHERTVVAGYRKPDRLQSKPPARFSCAEINPSVTDVARISEQDPDRPAAQSCATEVRIVDDVARCGGAPSTWPERR